MKENNDMFRVIDDRPKPKAVIYARTARLNAQAGISKQYAACMNYCQKQGIEVVHLFSDEASTGHIDERPGFGALISLLNGPGEGFEVSCIVVESYSRLGRKMADIIPLFDMLTDRGIKILSATESIDTEMSPETKYQQSMLRAVSEYEQSKRSERIKLGMMTMIAREESKRPSKNK